MNKKELRRDCFNKMKEMYARQQAIEQQLYDMDFNPKEPDEEPEDYEQLKGDVDSIQNIILDLEDIIEKTFRHGKERHFKVWWYKWSTDVLYGVDYEFPKAWTYQDFKDERDEERAEWIREEKLMRKILEQERN